MSLQLYCTVLHDCGRLLLKKDVLFEQRGEREREAGEALVESILNIYPLSDRAVIQQSCRDKTIVDLSCLHSLKSRPHTCQDLDLFALFLLSLDAPKGVKSEARGTAIERDRQYSERVRERETETDRNRGGRRAGHTVQKHNWPPLPKKKKQGCLWLCLPRLIFAI
jgi:hypothetical protein